MLFEPLKIGDLTLKNRIIMAPLTRCRASEGRVPNDLMATYYAQRADAGLILSEATSVNAMGVGYADTPGLWSEAQVAGWQGVTKAIHAKGGLIMAQLWHVGRISHPMFLDGAQPVSSSAVAPAGHVSLVRPKVGYEVPRALEITEIDAIIADYAKAAANAKHAGFDGVELHAANGYLIEQFLSDRINRRTDAYGGNIENRARFLFALVDAIGNVWPMHRIGLHLSPRGDSHDSGFSDAPALFAYIAEQAKKRGVGFIFTREYLGEGRLTPAIKRAFGGVVIANEKFDVANAEQALASGEADAVSWGNGFIANPDLVNRIRIGAPSNAVDWKTCYGIGGHGPVGYTDYAAIITA